MENIKYDERDCCNPYYKCPRKITKSNGAVLGRDLVEFMKTGDKSIKARELCGICSMTVDPKDIE